MFFLYYGKVVFIVIFFFSSGSRHTRWTGDWSSDVCSSDLGLQNLPWAGRYQLQPLGYDLYSGTSGVALFLAAIDYVTKGKGSSCYRDLALAATQPLCQALRYRARQMVRVIGIGGASGLGSVVYALVCISRFLDKPSLLEEAQLAALLITEEQIVSDRALDIIAGSAEAILGLLALYDASPGQAILERAIACGQHLLRVRTRSASGERSWQTIGGRLLTGFSHGAAGIIYALLRLFAATRDAAIERQPVRPLPMKIA